MTSNETDRCMAVLLAVHAEHNLRHYLTAKGVITHPHCIEVRYRGDLATFDGDELTRLVIAAHQQRVRVGLSGHMRGIVRIYLQPRKYDGSSMERHPGPERFPS